MDKFGLDGVVATSRENILYLSGFTSWSQNAYLYGNAQAFVIYPRDQGRPPVLLTPGGDMGYASLKEVWIKEINVFGSPEKPEVSKGAKLSPEETGLLALSGQTSKGRRPEEALSQVLREKGLEKSRIGIDQFGLPMGFLEKLKSLSPNATFLPASTFFRYVRMIKTEPEIERLKQAGIVNQRAVNALLKNGRPGISEEEFASVYRAELARGGGQNSWLHMGPNFPPLKDRILTKGDIIRMDMGCIVQGYNADTCVSASIGTPSDKHRKVYEALQTGILKSVEALKPGVLPSRLHEIMNQGVRAAGLPDFSFFFVGHTIGLEAREFPFMLGPAQEINDPFLPSTTDIPMERGMVVNLETSRFEIGWGCVAVEYSLVVTDKGYEYLYPPEQALHSLPLG